MERRSQQEGFSTPSQKSTCDRPSLQADIFQTLPPELLAHIFSYLCATTPSDPPSDIAACRLVNHGFEKHSSPLLLPRIVFARRLKELTKFRQILQHPYFRLHVTELVYDGSNYAEATATSFDQYAEDCERAPRDLEDVAWAENQSRGRTSWMDLGPFSDRSLKDASSIEGSRGPLGRARASHRWDEVSTPTPEFSNAFRLGCNKTFADYAQRYAEQEWIRKEGIDNNLLAAAFRSCPNLRSIVSTDYRGSARDGESYDACCRRLFGKVLEPQHAGVGGPAGIAGDDLFPLLRIVAEIPNVRIDRLAVGPHAFEYTGEDTSELADPYHPQNPRYLDISALENVDLSSDTTLNFVLGQLKDLRLALCYSGHCADEKLMRGQITRVIEASAPRLQKLTLHMIYLFWGGVREAPKVDNDTRFDVFNTIITPLHVPGLRSLSLRRWIFKAEELKAFLLTHASTLRDLHMLGCLCGDDEAELARWGGRTLSLQGIELSGFLSVLDTESANPHGWRCVSPEEWKQMEPTAMVRETRELENMWLDGRRNWVQRQQRREIFPEGEWWKQPASR